MEHLRPPAGRIVVVANPKGGTGKTTTTVAVAASIASRGLRVAVVDMDPRQVCHGWKTSREDENLPCPFDVIQMPNADRAEARMPEKLRARAAELDVLLVDTPGTQSLATVRAVARADFVVIASTASTLDAGGAADILQLVEEEGENLGRPIDHAVLLTRTDEGGVVSRTQRNAEAELRAGETRWFSTMIRKATPLDEMFGYGMTLNEQMRAFGRKNKRRGKQIERAASDVDAVTDELLSAIGLMDAVTIGAAE